MYTTNDLIRRGVKAPEYKGKQPLSEYQYYEFQAIDRPLSEADRSALRSLSTRARLTATSFTNHYEWGNFKGSPQQLMERWFDLHLYLANWGTRRLMIRLTQRLVDRSRLDALLPDSDMVDILVSGENLIVDIGVDIYDDESPEYDAEDEWDDGAGWLAALAPLRADVISGDLRLFYLLWLKALELDELAGDETEPLPGIGPLTGALEAFADFFHLDRSLLQSAVEGWGTENGVKLSADASREAIAAIPEAEKTALLQRLADGNPHVAAEVQARVRKAVALATGETYTDRRTAADLRGRAAEFSAAREAIEAERRQAQEAETARRMRLDAVRRREQKPGMKSNWRFRNVTPTATNKPQACSWICKRWPVRTAKLRFLRVAFARSVSGTRASLG